MGFPGTGSMRSQLSSLMERTRSPFTEAIASPGFRPTCSAGDPGATPAMRVEARGSAEAMEALPSTQLGTFSSSTAR